MTVTDVKPTVTLTKAVDQTTLPEPGGTFNYTLTVTNTSLEPVSYELTDRRPVRGAATSPPPAPPARLPRTPTRSATPRWAAGPTRRT